MMFRRKTSHAVLTLLLLLLMTPAYAAEYTVSPSEWHLIRALEISFAHCSPTNPDNPENEIVSIEQDCFYSQKLQEMLDAQGFCFYKRLLVGRKKAGLCEPMAPLGPAVPR